MVVKELDFDLTRDEEPPVGRVVDKEDRVPLDSTCGFLNREVLLVFLSEEPFCLLLLLPLVLLAVLDPEEEPVLGARVVNRGRGVVAGRRTTTTSLLPSS